MRDDYEEYDDERATRVERTTVWIVVLMLLGLTTAGSLWLRETDANHYVTGYAGRTGVLRSPDNGRMSTVSVAPRRGEFAVGTGGSAAYAGPTDDALDSAPTIREVEALTAVSDRQQLIGRKVDLQVPVQGRANNVSFWIGPAGNRMLVVLERDRRDGAMRQLSMIGPNDIAPMEAGQQASIAGTIEPVPSAEERYSWGLSYQDQKELADRPLYIRADSVRTE